MDHKLMRAGTYRLERFSKWNCVLSFIAEIFVLLALVGVGLVIVAIATVMIWA